MNWLRKLPPTPRYAHGLEWRLWRKLPLIAVVGIALPLAGLGLVQLLSPESPSAEQLRSLQLARYIALAAVVFHITMVATLAIGCFIVRIMKGPGYVADAYPVPHRDQPRPRPQTEDEAARERAG